MPAGPSLRHLVKTPQVNPYYASTLELGAASE